MNRFTILAGIVANLPGFLFAVAIGLAAWFTAPYVPGVNAIVLGLIAGIVIGNIFRLPWLIVPGIAFSGSRMLELSIVLLAFSISFSHILAMGWESMVAVLLMMVAVLTFTLLLSGKMRCPGGAGYLTGFGTAICGSAAIAALAPGIRTERGDIGMAMAVVNLMGALGMVGLPLLLGLLPFTEQQSGLIIGASLHSVGNVAGAGFALGDVAGAHALTIKLARVALLSPAVIVFTYLINRSDSGQGRQSLNLPFYLWAFVAITIFTSLVDLPSGFLAVMDTAGKVSLTIAMAAIGLGVSFRQLYRSGNRVLMFGALLFVIQLVLLFGWVLVRG